MVVNIIIIRSICLIRGLKIISADRIPVRVGSHAEVTTAGAAPAITEKTTCVACHLVPRYWHVLEHALLDGIVVRVKCRDGQLRQHVLLRVRQGVNLVVRLLIKERAGMRSLASSPTVFVKTDAAGQAAFTKCRLWW